MTLRGNEPKHSRSALGRAGMAWALKRASRVFTVSERLRQFAIGLGAAPANVKTIPNGVDAGVFYPRERAACRARYGLPLDRPIVLSAGALVERKGHHRVVRALHAIRAQRPEVLLVVAGGPGPEGRFEDQLRDTIAELSMTDSVRLAGQVDAGTLAELMSAADLFCLSSTNEGWPNVVHEALACGAPVVATDVGAIPDMLAGGANGIMVPAGDPAALEHALAGALARPWDRAAISVWGRARSWRQVACEAAAELQAITGALEHHPK
jgi:glycosyltransferase involved in cell wall biosynthesis